MIVQVRQQVSFRFPRNYTQQLLVFLALICISTAASSQMLIYPVQNFNFGSFYQGANGGTVELTTDGSRTASGGVVLIHTGGSYSQSIFEIEVPEGSVISILNGPDIILQGSRGGSLTLSLSNSDPISPFITSAVPPLRTTVRIGAILSIGSLPASPPGNYSGSFSITFHQE